MQASSINPHRDKKNTNSTIQLALPPEFCLLVHPDVFWLIQTETGEVLDRLGLCGREQQGLPLGGEVLHDGIQRLRETQVQNTVSFIQHWCREAQDKEMKRERTSLLFICMLILNPHKCPTQTHTQHEEVRDMESRSLIHVLQQASWSADDDIGAMDLLCLLLQILHATDASARQTHQ